MIRVRRIGQEDQGGTPILMVHGFTGSVEGWGEGILEGVARAGPVLAVDLPGHGESEGSVEPSRYAMERIVHDLVGVLDDHGVRQAVWVGYSMGGRIALAASILQPTRVARLVLESASPGIEAEDARARRRRQDELLAQRLETRGIEDFVDFWMAQPLFATQLRLPAAVLSDARRRRLRNDPRFLAAVLRGLGTGTQPSFWDRVGEIHVPSLLVTGALDRKFTATAERMQASLPNGSLAVVADSGHTVHLESPRRWLEAVLPFLQSAAARGSGRSESAA
jgi:2-succinyl-6-hydroxy-2,4-cyclohexadiene-1-carboxylate synthase